MPRSLQRRINFYPRPPRGGRLERALVAHRSAPFLSTPSARRATRGCSQSARYDLISIHALREEGDLPRQQQGYFCLQISIHALREEGDARTPKPIGRACPYFYPRPPRGGRLRHTQELVVGVCISIHALREEGDLSRCLEINLRADISIHALREEGDVGVARLAHGLIISIHALREEGDSKNRDKISIFKQIIQHSARI